MSIDLEVATSGPLVALAVRGELDIHTAPELRAALTAALDGGASQVVVDLAGLGFLDSSGISVLVAAHRRLVRQGGRLQLVGVSGAAARVLTVTGLTRVFDVRDADGVALAR